MLVAAGLFEDPLFQLFRADLPIRPTLPGLSRLREARSAVKSAGEEREHEVWESFRHGTCRP